MSVVVRVLACALVAASAGDAAAQSGSPYDSSPLAHYRAAAQPQRLPAVGQSYAVQPAQHVAWSEPRRMPADSVPPVAPPQSISLVNHVAGTNLGAYVTGCDTCAGGCGDGCGGCGDCCCLPPWAQRCGLFGEYLLLRARNADVAYAVPIDGGINPPILPPPVQRGPVGVADPEADSGFRVGGTYALDCRRSLTATFTRFESNTTDSISTDAPLALRQLVLHPQSANATADFLDASANLGLDYSLADADYRAVWWADENAALNYLVGIRWVRLEQDFEGTFTNAGTTELLSTGIDFEGAGLRLGIDGERHFPCCHNYFVYGRGTANLIGGESSGYYTQSTSPAAPTVDTQWSAARFITILELEVGGGWQSCCGRYRLSAGYQYNAWQDLVTADQFIQGVQNNDFVHMQDTIVFDGLNAKFEYRW